MKEIKPIGVEHLSQGVVSNWRNGCGLVNSGLDIFTVLQSVSYRYGGFYLSGKQVRYGNLGNMTAASTSGLVQIPLNKLFGDRTDYEMVVFGFRYKPGNVIGVAAIGLKTTLAKSDGATSPELTLYTIPSGSPEGYYEVVIIPYGKPGAGFFVYRDGEKILSLASNGSYQAVSIKDRYLTFGAANTETVPKTAVLLDYTYSLEDLYTAWSNVLGEDVRQGPMKIRRIPYSQVLPGDWVGNGGKSAIDVLNTTARTYATADSYLTSDIGNTVIRCKLDLTGISTYDNVLGMCVPTSAWKDNGTVGNLGFKWKHTDGETEDSVYSPPSGFSVTAMDVSMPVLYATPGGAALTKDSMAALELVVTPSA